MQKGVRERRAHCIISNHYLFSFPRPLYSEPEITFPVN